jgi:hypothetical protein
MNERYTVMKLQALLLILLQCPHSNEAEPRHEAELTAEATAAGSRK